MGNLRLAALARMTRHLIGTFALALGMIAGSVSLGWAYTASIKTLPSGRTVTTEVTGNPLVEEFKMQIESLVGIPYDNQKLIWGGTDLQDNRSFSDYGISAGTSRFLVTERVASVGGGNGSGPILVPGTGGPQIQLLAQVAPTGSALETARISRSTLNRAAGRLAAASAMTQAGLSGMGADDLQSAVTSAFWVEGGLLALTGFGEGDASNLVIGADWMMRDETVVGVYLSKGEVTHAGTENLARGVGIYGGIRLSDHWTVTAQTGVAETDYTILDTQTDGLRRMAAVGVSGNVVTSVLDLTGSVDMSGFQEEIAGKVGKSLTILGDTVRHSEVRASVLARTVRGLGTSQLRPFVDIGIGSATQISDLRGRSSDTFTDLSLGLSGGVGPGLFAVNLSAGQSGQGLQTRGLIISYQMQF